MTCPRSLARGALRALLLAGASVPWLAAPLPAQPAESKPIEVAEVTHDTSPDATVVELFLYEGELHDEDAPPRVTVFGDGRVLVQYPHDMIKAGAYELRLSDSELDALLAGLVENGVMTFDGQAVTKRKSTLIEEKAARAKSTGGEVRHVSSDTTSVFRVTLESYRPAGAKSAVPTTDTRTVEYKGIRTDVREFGDDLPAVKGLAAAQQALLRLADSPRLAKLDDKEPAKP